MGKEDHTQNEHRYFLVDFQDENGKKYTCRMTVQEGLNAGLPLADFGSAYNALRVVVYSDVIRVAAGLPSGGTVSQ